MVGEGVKQMFEKQQSKRRRQAEWDRQHVITVSTHLNEMENAFFRLACALEGTTRYAVMQKLVRDWVENWYATNSAKDVLPE